MNRHMGVVVAFILGMLPADGCGPTQQPVRVFADATDYRRLHGEWVGEYTSAVTGRSGTIYFSLEAGKDTAYGSVVMLASQLETTNAVEDHDQVPSMKWRAVQTLSISFIVVDGVLIRGTMDPYHDPQCNCTVVTTFEGKFERDAIAGTYSSLGGDLGTQTIGVWKVVRKTDGPII